MSGFENSTATLRFFGDDLDPDAITARLGCYPTHCARKGDVTTGRVTGLERSAKTGSWLLSASQQKPENLDLQISEILAQLTDDLEVWREMTEKYQSNLFCGLFMSTGNDAMSISPTTLLALGARGLEVWLDVYHHLEDEQQLAL